MKKVVQHFGALALAAVIGLGVGIEVDAKVLQNVKAEKEVKEVQTGRTAQARVVDAITVNDITTAERYAETAPLVGSVVIDGPELHLTVNGQQLTL